MGSPTLKSEKIDELDRLDKLTKYFIATPYQLTSLRRGFKSMYLFWSITLSIALTVLFAVY